MANRIKSVFESSRHSDRLFFAVVVVLVGLLAYGLGQQSSRLDSFVTTGQPQPAMVFMAAPNDPVAATATPVVASRGGTKYHRPDCSSAKSIKNANLIRFASIELAEAAGYKPAANCF